MPTLFSKIISGELPAYKVAEDAQFLAFLDINPNAKGHTLCIHKVETDKLFDLDEPAYLALMAFSRKVAMALEQVVSCKRVGMTVIGLEVPHVHVHLIPLNAMEDAQFNKKVQIEPEEFAQLAQSIQEQFNKRE